MIHTNSVLRGNNASLSFLFISLAFFIGTFTILDLPSEKQLKVHDIEKDDVEFVISCQQIVHFFSLIVNILTLF